MTTRPPVYLDHAATTPVRPEVAAAMAPFLTDSIERQSFGNPSSLHRWGRQAKKALDHSRSEIATCLGASPEEILLTSGGTEADNLAVLGVTQSIERRGDTRHHLITTEIEHAAVAKPMWYLQEQGWAVTCLPVNAEGVVSLEDLKAAVRADTALVSIMHGNNEIGSLQPIAVMGAFLRERQILFHTDAVQTVGKLAIDLKTLPVDYLSLSAHKLYGPKGVGGLYIRQGALMPTPLIFGGGQENAYRSGTENVAGIIGLARALRLAVDEMTTETPRLQKLQQYLIDRIRQELPQAVLNGVERAEHRVPGNVNFSFPPHEGESLILQLDLAGIAASTGSACKSALLKPSEVVLATGKPESVAKASVRFSLGHSTTEADLSYVVETLKRITATPQNLSSQSEIKETARL